MRERRRWTCLTMTDTTLTPGDHESRQGGRRAAYDYQWRAFASWCLERDGEIPLPVPASTVAEYLTHRVEAGASHSTLRVIAAAIARQHADLQLANPCEDPIVESVLAESERSAPPAAPRSLPLHLEAYRAIRKTAQRPRPGRGGWDETLLSARDRGRMDVAMIGLMRDGMLRVKEAAVITWSSIECRPDGTGRVTVGEGDSTVSRVLSTDTMRLLDAVRGDAADDERVLGLMPNQISARIGGGGRTGWAGSGLWR